MAGNEILVTVTADDSLLDELLVCAFEGGSNYWIEHVKKGDGERNPKACNFYETLFADGRTVSIREVDEEAYHLLDKAKALAGLQLLANLFPKRMSDILTTNYDAEDADVWLQLALFQEVVYG